MSSNHLSYDSCAYKSKIDVSQGPMDYAPEPQNAPKP